MKINQSIYPYNIEARKLPIHLTGIGGTEWQSHIVRVHGYQWHQILFCDKGSGVLKYDNTYMPVEANTFFFLPAGYPHEYYSENANWDVKWVTFDGYAVNHIISLLDMTSPVVIKPNDPNALKKMFSKMLSAQTSDKLYGDLVCSGLIYEYVIEFHRNMNNKANKVISKRNNLLMPVLNYMDENFRSNFSMAQLAESVGISPQHLCRVFKSAMNMRPNEYLTLLRIRESKHLLETSDLPISEIATQSGFPDAGYFSTVFKKHEGMTPMEYKNSLR